MTRPAQAIVNLRALRANYVLAKQRHGGKVMAVLKANAYGHGAVRCASALADIADAFAVAFTEEALQLRDAGITAPILVLEGAFDAQDVAHARRHGFWLVAHQDEQLRMLECEATAGPPVAVWLKVDTGMHRAGIGVLDVERQYGRLVRCSSVSAVTLMTHLSSADELDSPATVAQLRAFDRACEGIAAPRSAANSAGILAWNQARHQWGRAGLMLYGVDPIGSEPEPLQPVMTLKSRVFAVRSIASGEAVGYGATFVAERPTRVGLVAMGYADGYPRCARSGTPVAVDGQPTSIIGRVSMDMLTVDLTDLLATGIGSEVELWGPQVPVSAVAAVARTIPYELLCNVKRVPFTYSDAIGKQN